MVTALKMFGPVFSLPCLGLLYYDLNVNRRLFVKRLGCGCNDGFNTNHLTYLFCFALIGAVGYGAWSASRGVSQKWRISYLCGVVVLFWEFLGYFMDRNLWA